ncbi:TfoX/Sxy family DNA transformation protein [Necropsobacter massiliensis]|uniref:TfoX/Sxy family DNA transformation protein n=1 Tax=Necropsobacter massiliensis TaxID=1400001 RepID=UPI000595CC4A|nr:TfoX/Sxy family DNA transformation protein [Necropsobacter massiliensis]
MTVTQANTLEIRQMLSELIGNVTARNLFTGYGLFKDDLMFGIYQNGNFYLRAEAELAVHLESQGAVSYSSLIKNIGLNIGNYYRLPKAIMQNKDYCRELLLLSIEQIKAQRLAEALAKKNRIKELPNLSIKHERLLAKIGIGSIAAFKAVGAANCYVRLKQDGFSVNMILFWNLAAALLNKHVNLLTAAEKERALFDLNNKLSRAGLSPVKSDVGAIR